MHFARSLKRSREPDLTPLIDIVFQLVIFFMLTTSFIAAESIELSLPSDKKNVAVSRQQQAMQVQIASTGHVTVNDKAVNKNELEDQIILWVAKNPEKKIQVLSTPGVSVQQLVTVIDMITQNGGRHVEVDKLEYGDISLGNRDVIEVEF